MLALPAMAQTVDVAKGAKSFACQEKELFARLSYFLEMNDMSDYYTEAPQDFRSGKCIAFAQGRKAQVVESDSRGLVKVRFSDDPTEYWTDPRMVK